MKLKIDTTETLYLPEVAVDVAAALQINDKDWSYVVVHDPKGTGLSFIEVYDEDGEFVGKV